MSSELTITSKQESFSGAQIAALSQLGMQDASDGDLELFFHYVQRTGLNPFARQIYMIGRKTKVGDRWVTKQTIQVGIDGFRLIARRAIDKSHEAYGEPEVLWCGEDGTWHDVWLDRKTPPSASKAVVQRGEGIFTGTATYAEYAGTRFDKKTNSQVVNSMWASKPAVMLAKCAEALALRKAFPQDLAGIYMPEEIQEEESAPQHVEVIEPSPSKDDCKRIVDLMKQGGVTSKTQAESAFKALTGRNITSSSDLTLVEAESLLSSPEMVVSRTREALEESDEA